MKLIKFLISNYNYKVFIVTLSVSLLSYSLQAAYSIELISDDDCCTNTPDGEIRVTADGNSGPYTVMWSTGASTVITPSIGVTTATLSNLAQGMYTAVVSNAYGCESTFTINVGQTSCDDCSPECHTGLLILGTPLPADVSIFQTQGEIISTSQITPNTDIMFRSPQKITLDMGFSVPVDGIFSAVIENCILGDVPFVNESPNDRSPSVDTENNTTPDNH